MLHYCYVTGVLENLPVERVSATDRALILHHLPSLLLPHVGWCECLVSAALPRVSLCASRAINVELSLTVRNINRYSALALTLPLP